MNYEHVEYDKEYDRLIVLWEDDSYIYESVGNDIHLCIGGHNENKKIIGVIVHHVSKHIENERERILTVENSTFEGTLEEYLRNNKCAEFKPHVSYFCFEKHYNYPDRMEVYWKSERDYEEGATPFSQDKRICLSRSVDTNDVVGIKLYRIDDILNG